MIGGRTFRTDRTPDIAYPAAQDPDRQCRARIELDGAVYHCRRDHVDGAHDAFEVHSHDGGLVRW